MLGLSRISWAWALFDAGHWAFASVTFTTLLPILFVSYLHGVSSAPMTWAGLTAMFTLGGALVAPLVGSHADRKASRKVWLYLLLLTQMAATVILVTFLDLMSASVALLVLAIGCMSGIIALSLYNALILFVQERSDLPMVSAISCGISNFGAAAVMTGLGMLTITTVEITSSYAIIATMIASVFALVCVSFMYWEMPEPQLGVVIEETSFWQQSIDTYADISRNRELLKLILALFIFSDATSTMYTVHVVFAASIGIGGGTLLTVQVMNRWAAVLFALGWALLSTKLSTRTNLIASAVVSLVCCALLADMNNAIDYWIMNGLLSCSGTGMFIFSRVLVAHLTPLEKAGQNFGVMACVNKMSGFVGPAIYSVVGFMFNSARAGLYVMLIFGVLGLWLLWQVDIERAVEQSHEPIVEDVSTQCEDEPALYQGRGSTT